MTKKAQKKSCAGHQHCFHGSTTLGEKGQVVIPAEAREVLHLKKSDKLLVFSHGETLMLTKLSQIEKLAVHFSKKLDHLQNILKHASKNKK